MPEEGRSAPIFRSSSRLVSTVCVGGFDSEAAADAFGSRVAPLLGKWCCRPHEGSARSGGLTVDELLTLQQRGFALAFSPPLRQARSRRGGGGGAAEPQQRWETTLMTNNVFGRAELARDTACCRYLGRVDSLSACIGAAEAAAKRGVAASSVTWHRAAKPAATSTWARTCYAIVDGTWQPVPVTAGQAEADAARIAGLGSLAPLPEMAQPWVDDAVTLS